MTKNASQKTRVLVRPWQPRHIPYQVTEQQLQTCIESHVQEFEQFLYLGWSRRKEDGKRVVKFLLATGPTRQIAKQRFKQDNLNSPHIWEIGGSD